MSIAVAFFFLDGSKKRAFGLELLGHMIIATQMPDDAAPLHFHDLS